MAKSKTKDTPETEKDTGLQKKEMNQRESCAKKTLGTCRKLMVGAIGALVVATALVEWRMSYLVLVDQERTNSEEMAEKFKMWEKKRELIPVLDDEDTVELYYGEHLLASWVLDASPWNAFHSGMIFRVRSKGNKFRSQDYTIEYTPTFTDTVAYVLHPLIDPVFPQWMPHFLGVLYARVFSSYDLVWQNHASVKYHVGIPAKFTNFTSVGTMSGAMFNKLMTWVEEYDKTHKSFEPVEIVMLGSKEGGMTSTMCHDLFYHALYALTEFGFVPKPKDYIFRDHIMVFASEYQLVDHTDPVIKQEIVRYYRMFMTFMELINVEFTNIRTLLVSADTVSVVPYLYYNGKYYRVQMASPYVNYCYLAVSMPPLRSSVWDSEHLCALEQNAAKVANLTFEDKVRRMTEPRNVLYVLENIVDDSRVWTGLCVGYLTLLAAGYMLA